MRLAPCALLLCAASLAAADDFKPEPGYALLFNGKDLSGWQQTAAKKDDKPVPLEGKTDAFDRRFVVKDGQLVIDPKVKGDRYIETLRQFGGDVTIRYDFKPEDGCNNDTLLLGTKFDIKVGGKDGLKNLKVGEWNTMEIAVKGGSAAFVVNGEKLATQKTKGGKGPLTLRAEAGAITYKNIRATQ